MAKEPKNWIISKAVFDKTFLNNLQEKTQMSTAMLQFLCRRGYVTKEMINELLQPQDHSDFLDYQDGEKLLHIVQGHHKEKILIYSDFDCDGICAAVIASKGLKDLGYNCLNYFNSRFQEGYGFKEEGVTFAINHGCKLIISLDQGSNDFDAINSANNQGVQVVVIDHHQLTSELSTTAAIVNPCRHGEKLIPVSYCAGALSFQFIQALAKQMNVTVDFSELLAYVALCTLSDVMELKDSNRYYVKSGLLAISQSPLAAFQVFKNQLQKTITADDLRFTLAPQINAVGRLTDDVQLAFDFLASTDYQQAKDCYQSISALNKERQFLTKVQLQQALIQIDENAPVNFIVGNFHQGLVGILAGRIKSLTDKVTVVLSEDADQLIGSIRAINGINLQKVLAEVDQHVMKYGGHDVAAGITLMKEKLEVFKQEFSQQIGNCESVNDVYLDLVYQSRYLRQDDVSQWELLAPYGPGFEYPIFGFVLENYQYQILKDQHLKISTATIDVMAFNCIKYLPVLQTGKTLKVLVKFERDRFNKYQAVLLEEDIRLL